MSKLHVEVDTDMIKTSRTARGNKNISVAMGFDPNDYSKKLYTTLIRDGNNIRLEVETRKPFGKIVVCRGTVEDGLTECQPYSFAGPMPKEHLQLLINRP